MEENIKKAIDHHMDDMSEEELVMVLKYIHNLKDFR
jgi:hypothetical protein